MGACWVHLLSDLFRCVRVCVCVCVRACVCVHLAELFYTSIGTYIYWSDVSRNSLLVSCVFPSPLLNRKNAT